MLFCYIIILYITTQKSAVLLQGFFSLFSNLFAVVKPFISRINKRADKEREEDEKHVGRRV